MKHLFCSFAVIVSSVAFAQAESPPESEAPEKREPEPKSDGPFAKGKVVFRGGVDLDLSQTINLGGDNSGSRTTGGVNLGVGFFVIDNLSLDLDLSGHFFLTPTTGLQDLGATPGLRYQFIPQAYVRGGAPLIFHPAFGLGVLAGGGFTQPISNNVMFVVGADYTYYLTSSFRRVAPSGKIDLHGGIQTSF